MRMSPQWVDNLPLNKSIGNMLNALSDHSEPSPLASFRCPICNGEILKLFPFDNSAMVAHCAECGTESIRPLPAREELEAYYTNYPTTKTAEDEIRYLTNLSVEALRFYIGKMNLSLGSFNDKRFVEVGFGNGAGMFAGCELGLRSYGVDMDPVGVANTKSLAEKWALDVTCSRDDVAGLRKFGVRFDIVKASQILEHVLDPYAFLSEISAVQSSGGYLIIECPNNDAAFWEIKNRARKVFNRMNFYNSLKLHEHLWGYTKNGLSRLLERAGYRVLFLRDYAVGDAIFQPQTVLWYSSVREGIRQYIKTRNSILLVYPCVRIFDQVASRLFRKGTGLAVLCQKVGS